MACLSRRSFVARAALLLPVLTGCGAAAADAPDGLADDAVEVTELFIRVRFVRVTALASIGGAFVIPKANVIVIRVAAADYRALSNVSTHAGCGISQFVDARLRCKCHGSEFDANGTNVVGPAETPLQRYEVTLDALAQELRIARG